MASNKVTLQTVAWFYDVYRTCAETAQFHVARAMSQPKSSVVHHFGGYSKSALCKDMLVQNHIQQERNGSARNQRIALYYSCHCEALSAHLR